jgi:hypothetical protein
MDEPLAISVGDHRFPDLFLPSLENDDESEDDP